MTTDRTASRRRIAVIGAGGQAGRAVVGEATRRGHHVTAAVRDPRRHAELGGPLVQLVSADALDAASVTQAAAGTDAIVSAVNPFTAPPASFDDFDPRFYERVAQSLLAAATAATARRVIVVGLFATLRVPGGLVLDDPALFPPDLRPFAAAHAAAIAALQASDSHSDWLVLAPPPKLDPDLPRTGRYRLGDDSADLDQATHPLSYGDLAVAVVDELEQPSRHRELAAVNGT